MSRGMDDDIIEELRKQGAIVCGPKTPTEEDLEQVRKFSDFLIAQPPRKPAITCPRCGKTSYLPTDIEQGYCGHCHDWTAF